MADLLQRIKEFNKDRLPELIRTKMEVMKENPFRFYRGTCHLFYEDLSKRLDFPASPVSWVCGDLHLENFGSFKSDNRLVYFDLNDFDEAVLAPAAFEVVRMTTSIFIAFDSLGIESRKAEKMAALFLKSYSDCLQRGKPDYIEPNTAKGIVCEFLTDADNQKQKTVLLKRTYKGKNKLKIMLDHPRHLKLDKELKKELFAHMQTWLQHDGDSPYNYKVLDIAFRIAGTGSLGLKRYVILLQTLNETGEKYLLIDMKQATCSSLIPYIQVAQPEWTTQASRIAEIQQRMQNRPPALLSTAIFKGEPYIMQEMQPEKDSINFKLLKKRYRDMYRVIDDMGMLTASSQLRSSGRQGSAIADDLIAFGKDDSWKEPLLDYSRKYAEQVKKEQADFVRIYKQTQWPD